ncbi:hypothetical protein M1D51_19575 [Arthrobacter sp. R3-55]
MGSDATTSCPPLLGSLVCWFWPVSPLLLQAERQSAAATTVAAAPVVFVSRIARLIGVDVSARFAGFPDEISVQMQQPETAITYLKCGKYIF